MAIKGTVWDYEYEEYEENGDLVKRKLHLVYNLKALKIYYNFFDSDLMGDFSKSAMEALKRFNSLPEELKNKINKGEEFTEEDLTEDTLSLLMNGVLNSNNDFTIRATIALIAAGEDRLRPASEIEDDLPITVTEETYKKNLIEFISFCSENSKKNRITPVWVAR